MRSIRAVGCNERTTTPPSRTTSEQFSVSNGIWNMIPQIAIKNPNRESNGTPCYGLVHLLVHLGSAKNPMFIGLGTGGTPVHPPGYPPRLKQRQVAPPTAKPRSPSQSIRGYPNLSEATRGHPNLSEVKYFFFAIHWEVDIPHFSLFS